MALGIFKIIHFVLILLYLFHGSYSQSNSSRISLGSTMSAGSNDSWRSPSVDFAFGFYRLPNGLYLLGIWFDRVPEKTLVWSANRDIPVPANSFLQLNGTGQFVLSFSNGSTTQFIYTGTDVSSGLMRNDGNFVLTDSNSIVQWQSFHSPTDTILPGQVINGGTKLFSAKSTSDFSTGNFMLEMQLDGNLVLSSYKFSNRGYCYTATLFRDVSLVFNSTTALMYLVNETEYNIYALTNTAFNITPVDQDYYHRAIIDVHGDFQQQVFLKSNGSRWETVWKAIEEPCNVNSVCGLNGVCFSPDNNETLTCDCLPGYVHLDPNDMLKGCKQEKLVNYCSLDPMSCNFTVQVINDTDLDFPGQYFADLARLPNHDFRRCKQALMDDCYAIAATLKGSTCYKKTVPLMNARKSFTTKGTIVLIKVPNISTRPNPNFQGGDNKRENFDIKKFLKIGDIVTASLALCFGAIAVYYHPATRNLLKKKQSIKSSNAVGINFREFTFAELLEATNRFTKTLGRGSSGKVYGGKLRLNEVNVDIAVKKLDNANERNKKEFVTEIRIIGRTYHKNLVRLLGFCIDNIDQQQQQLLVYELMPNGTLASLLFGKGERLSWFQRAEIALGIARGLLYLHEECETQIIHCDIKPQNVLVDANYNAKISDFGLSKLLNKDQTRTDTRARGTVGYMAPEWLRGAPITTKVDVYSYGVMLLEIICCRRHIELERVEEESEEDDLILSKWVMSCIQIGKLELVVGQDPDVLSDFKVFERMALVGIWCIHPDPILRPCMKKITQMLEGTVDVGIPPLLV